MPEKRTIHVVGDKPREVWLHRVSAWDLDWRTASEDRNYGTYYGASYDHNDAPLDLRRSEEEALDAFADQVREEIEMQKLDDYNDKREAEGHV